MVRSHVTPYSDFKLAKCPSAVGSLDLELVIKFVIVADGRVKTFKLRNVGELLVF